MIIGGLSVVLLCSGFVILPLLLERLFGLKTRQSRRLLFAAAVVCLVASMLAHHFPREHRLANFGQHFFGGGLATALIYLYLRRAFAAKGLSILQDLTLLFFFVSGIGALNELLEFLLDQITNGMYSIDRWDTWYDILANSLGALTGWLIWKVYTSVRTMK